ncbi:MAG TPA: SMI1/KNR4 family protein [Gemmatimonadaceae bacterium]
MSLIGAEVAAYYEALGADPRPGVAPEELIAFESANRLTLPASVREFYLSLDGLDGEVPEFGFYALQLWPLAKLTRVSVGVTAFRGVPDYGPIIDTLPDADEYVAFGDGAIWSHVLAFRLCRRAGPVLWICGGSYAEIASDFDDFWRRYLQNPDALLWPSADQIISPAG